MLLSSSATVFSPAGKAQVTPLSGRCFCQNSAIAQHISICHSRSQLTAAQAGRGQEWASTPPRPAAGLLPQLHRQQPAQQAPQHQQEQLQRRRPQQQLPQPDPAADDLDLLAAAASGASVTTSLHVGAAVNPSSTRQPASVASALSPITSIPDAEPKYALPVGRKLRYAAADKLQLSGEEMRDIGRRLRTERRGPRPVLRVWRYGIDDLRLYQAIDLADLEGVVVVVDSTADADVVLTTYSKRTRKNVNLATARRAAAGAGVPLLVLPAMSAQRLVEAVGPLLGLPTVQDSPQTGANVRQQQEQRQPQQQWGPSQQPRLLRWDEIEGDGSEELLQLMWGGDAASSSRDVGALDPAAKGEAVAGACCPSPRWLAWCAAQEASPGCADAVWAAVRDADVGEPRGEAVPANPTARAGERHRLLKPLRPGSRIKRRKLRRDLALRQVDW